MAISREEIIKELDVMGGNCSTDYDYIVCHQAISDMEKLQKIEKIVGCTDGCLRPQSECYDCMYEKLDAIEQILKEVE